MSTTLYTVNGANACWDNGQSVNCRVPTRRKSKWKLRQTPLCPSEDAHVHSDKAIARLSEYKKKMEDGAKNKVLPTPDVECIVNMIGSRLHNMSGLIKTVYPTGQVDVYVNELNRELRFSVDELVW